MNALRKYRARPGFRLRQRNRFAKVKPRKRKGGLKICSSKPRRTSTRGNSSAAGSKPSRRLNRLPEWTDPKSYITKDKRHRIHGEDYQRLRWKAYERSQAKCEGGCGRIAGITFKAPHPNAGEMAHNEHGAKKSDELHRVKWKNWLCHRYEHDTGRKTCAPKEKRHA